MYFPYFPSNQYELLALKELVNKGLLSKSVIPIIELVRHTSTFDSTIRAFAESQNRIAVILDSMAEDFAISIDFLDDFIMRISNIANIEPALHMSDNTASILQMLEKNGIDRSSVIVHFNNRDYLESYNSQFASIFPKYTLFPDESMFRRIEVQNKVLFMVGFNKQIGYANKLDDEFFTEDHLFYKEEGYSGFGDFSIIGYEYLRGSRFAQSPDSIHIVYFDDAKRLRMRHFGSDSDSQRLRPPRNRTHNRHDIADAASRFIEAAAKLKTWFNNGQQQQLTTALATLLDNADSGYYPGQPTIYKLSIMHHLELIGKYLDGGMSK